MMTTVTASTSRRNRPPLDSSQAASIFAAMGVPEVDDRPEVDRLLSTVHAGVRTVWRSVRCFGASEAAVAAHTRIRPEKVAEYLLRADRAIEAQGEVPSEVARRARESYPEGFADAMRSCIEPISTLTITVHPSEAPNTVDFVAELDGRSYTSDYTPGAGRITASAILEHMFHVCLNADNSQGAEIWRRKLWPARLAIVEFMGPLAGRLDVESEDEEERERAVALAVEGLPVNLVMKGGDCSAFDTAIAKWMSTRFLGR